MDETILDVKYSPQLNELAVESKITIWLVFRLFLFFSSCFMESMFFSRTHTRALCELWKCNRFELYW